MDETSGDKRRYNTLCRVLDSLCEEAPASAHVYHPPSNSPDKLIQARSRALLHLFLKARFGMIRFQDRERMVTDGPHDGGIDAYFIDQRSKHTFVLQSKFRATHSNFKSHNMSADDLLRMDVKRILAGKKTDEKGAAYNDKIKNGLQRAVQKLPDAGSYTTKVILLGNAKRFSAGALKKLIEGYSVDQFSHDRIYSDLLFPVIDGTYFSDPDLTIEINLANLRGDTHLDYDVRAQAMKSNVKLLFAPTVEIGRIMHTYKNSILKFNPRSFLELSGNKVNKEIEASIRNAASNEFALFNNGVTITSDLTSISSNTARQGTAQLVLHNPQLVNGGQTAYTLSRIYEECENTDDFSLFKGKEVLLRVITFVSSNRRDKEAARLKLIGAISKASNSQTKIDESDRRSNDEIQIKLQKIFFDKYGMYYERKRGEFSDGIHSGYIDSSVLIKRERLIRVALANDFRVNLARSNIAQFFTPKALEALLRLSEVDKYAYGHDVLLRLFSERRKPSKVGDRYHTRHYGQALRYGYYAVVAIAINVFRPKGKSESHAVKRLLAQWPKFEKWVQARKSNAAYLKEEGSFDFVNYYKGATVNSDLKKYKFAIE